MDVIRSEYFRSLPQHMREQVLSSGISFESDEEVSMFLKNTIGSMKYSSVFPLNGYPYAGLF